jgi:hypothetical protein
VARGVDVAERLEIDRQHVGLAAPPRESHVITRSRARHLMR